MPLTVQANDTQPAGDAHGQPSVADVFKVGLVFVVGSILLAIPVGLIARQVLRLFGIT